MFPTIRDFVFDRGALLGRLDADAARRIAKNGKLSAVRSRELAAAAIALDFMCEFDILDRAARRRGATQSDIELYDALVDAEEVETLNEWLVDATKTRTLIMDMEDMRDGRQDL